MAILVLLFRRLPIVLSLYKLIPAIKTWREAVFTGWFGPIGVGAIFYYSVAIESLPEDGINAHARQVIKPIIYFMVLSSVIAHGITIPLFYIGTFATRTLTRTSENGNQVLRIPKIENFIGRKPTSIKEVDLSDSSAEKPIESPPEPRHTAITILTPEDVKRRQEDNLISQDHSGSRSPTISKDPLSEDSLPHHNTNRRRSHVALDEDDCTLYLP